MNINIDGLREIQAGFGLLEGEAAALKMMGGGSYCLTKAIENLERMTSRPFDPEFDSEFDTCGEIYGDGGWHRYYLYRNGEIGFSKSHGSSAAKDAATLGFMIV